MSGEVASGAARFADAVLAGALFAVDPVGGGVVLRASPGPLRDRWLDGLRSLLSETSPVRRVPSHVSEGRLLGGLDLAATLAGGRPLAERGILAEADGGVVLLTMSERLAVATAAHVAHVLDTGELVLERDGLAVRLPSRIGVVALDEGLSDDERTPPLLRDRLAFPVDLHDLGQDDVGAEFPEPRSVARARARLPEIETGPGVVEALCEAALVLGIEGVRAPLLALRVARASAALAGRDVVREDDAALAARLVLAPRAQALPAFERDTDEESPPPDAADPRDESAPGESMEPESPRADDDVASAPDARSLAEQILAAAEAALPPGLLATLRAAERRPVRASIEGKSGERQRSPLRGRPSGVRRGDPRAGGRLHLLETLRAAAPWQRLRAAEVRGRQAGARRLEIRRDDFRVIRFRRRTETTTLFVVDASGSTALHRLAEAKGAVELLLAECYVRRDRVALVAFRGREAELLLPPTRSLLRAKRGLAGLPGGGGTPLAAGIDAATELVRAVQRRGGTPVVLILTDGQANVARDGTGGRARAADDALAAARSFREYAPPALLVDTSPRPQPLALSLARALGASYLPLPHANATAIHAALRDTEASMRRSAR